MIDGELYFNAVRSDQSDHLRLFIPRSKRRVLYTAHDNQMYGGHTGIKKTNSELRDMYWASMSNDLEDYIRSCDTCQRFKNPKTPQYGLLQPIPSSEIGQRLHVDIVGPVTRSSNGNLQILTAIDAFSTFGYARAVSRMRSKMSRSSLMKRSLPNMDHLVP